MKQAKRYLPDKTICLAFEQGASMAIICELTGMSFDEVQDAVRREAIRRDRRKGKGR